MNKQDLIGAVLADKESGFETKASAERAVNTVLQSIEAGLTQDGVVQLIGFGTFAVKSRAARKGRNPATGEEITIKATKTIGFKAGTSLKEAAQKSKAE